MKNFKSDGFKGGNGGNGFERARTDTRRPEGRYNTGRPARDEKRGDQQELFKATCTTCSKPCEVPFRPDGIKPVLCRDCFARKNAAETAPVKRFPETSFKQPREYQAAPTQRPTAQNNADFKLLIKQIGEVEVKVNQILKFMSTMKETPAVTPVAPQTATTDATPAVIPVKVRKPKKVVVKKVVKPVTKTVVKKVVKKVVIKKKAK